jgi:hypothetical protein
MVGRPPDPQLGTVHRLAKASTQPALMRQLPDGAVHLIVAGKGVVEHYYIDAGGAATNVETAKKVDQFQLGNSIMVVGVLVLLVNFVAGAFDGVRDRVPFGALMVTCGAGLIVLLLGDHVRASSFAPMRKFAGHGWSRWESLERGGAKWAPLRYATVAQLRAIEDLALAHGRHAALRHLGDQGIEVVTKSGRGLERRLLTRSGAFLLPPPSSQSEGYAFSFASLAKRARQTYGGADGEWAELDLRSGD